MPLHLRRPFAILESRMLAAMWAGCSCGAGLCSPSIEHVVESLHSSAWAPDQRYLPQTTVDWDAEIRKLNSGELDGKPRPRGWDDLSDAEKAIARSKTQVQAKVRQAQESAQGVFDNTSFQVQ